MGFVFFGVNISTGYLDLLRIIHKSRFNIDILTLEIAGKGDLNK